MRIFIYLFYFYLDTAKDEKAEEMTSLYENNEQVNEANKNSEKIVKGISSLITLVLLDVLFK